MKSTQSQESPRAPWKKASRKKHGPKKKKITFQDVYKKLGSSAFGPSKRCVATGSASASKRIRKTPSEDPVRCLGKVRLGQDGSHLYIAQKTVKKNPKIKFSTTPTGRGVHLAFKWTKLYNARTGKPYDVSKSPTKWKFLS